MSKATKELTKRKRASRGQGRLFKKVNGKEYPAESNIKGNYYFAYSINGKRIVQALRDEDDNPITNKAKAEEERKRILAPLAAGSKIESLKAIAAKLADAEERRAEAVENTRSKILLNHAWKHYEQHPNRPQAGVAPSAPPSTLCPEMQPDGSCMPTQFILDVNADDLVKALLGYKS